MPRKRLVGWLALPVICILAASWCFSLALEGGWLKRSLSARLAATFGRPVEVARFGFSILGGPRFEADSVTVGEDPRFGEEYFLRAERLTARLRWSALIHGRMEFDRLSLSRPSLNLVRSADGQWNVETWLPPANAQTSLQPYRSPAHIPARASRIDIEAGRINFKRGTEKLPFAFVDVSGSLDPLGAGRWALDLQAHPMRAAVLLQKSGTLRLRGTIGGTSARLQPADLRLSWEDASIADAARLARGTDYGLRGLLDADFTARIDGAGGEAIAGLWRIEGGLRLQALHRWDLAARPDNPALNVKIMAAWRPAEARVEIEHWLVEAPHSNLDGEASIDWADGFYPEVRLTDSQIGLPDLVNWSRAFFPSRAGELDLAGSLGMEARFAGWPLRIEDVSVEGSGATVRTEGELPPMRIGALRASWKRSSLVLAPVAVRLAPPALNRAPRGAKAEALPEEVFHIDGSLGPIGAGDPMRDWPYMLTISGQTPRLQDLRAAVAALGWQFAPNWTIAGPASLQLVCTGALRRGAALVRGRLDFRNVRLATSAINEPILVSAASVQFSPGERQVTIGDAQALSGHWKGAVQRSAPNADWTFDLSAERLDFEQLGQALGQSRGLLYRVFSFSGPSLELAPETQEAIARISAQGRLHVDQLSLGGLLLESIDAAADLQRGALTLRRAQADLYGGRVSGEFRAQLGTELRYSFEGQVDRTDLSALAALTSSNNGFGGIGSGEVQFAARGFGRQALLASLEGEGFLHVQDATLELLDLPWDATDASFREVAGNRFRNSTVSFRVANGKVRVDPWLLTGRQRQLEIVGDVDFSHRLDMQVRSISRSERLGAASEPSSGNDVWVLGGTLDAPQIVREERALAGSQAIVPTGPR